MWEILEALAIYILIRAAFLWVGMKLTKVGGTFLAMIIISAISTFVLLIPIPFMNLVFSAIVMFVLICKWTDANFFPDAVLMVVVANGAAMLVGTFLNLVI